MWSVHLGPELELAVAPAASISSCLLVVAWLTEDHEVLSPIRAAISERDDVIDLEISDHSASLASSSSPVESSLTFPVVLRISVGDPIGGPILLLRLRFVLLAIRPGGCQPAALDTARADRIAGPIAGWARLAIGDASAAGETGLPDH